jgi:uncharacterized cofD-like protein/HAD superfamily hydrolase (TIGR01549 family)
MIKGIIFDLDDTLFDCTGTLVDAARRRCAQALSKFGFPEKADVLYDLINDLSESEGAKADVFGIICKKYSIDERKTNEFVNLALDAYNSDNLDCEISLFDGVKEQLIELKKSYKLALITSGSYKRQKNKIRLLNLKPLFDLISIDSEEEGKTKTDYFKDALSYFKLKPSEMVSVGDRVVSEIKAGNRLGMYTIQFLHGRHKSVLPKSDLEEPDYRIDSLSELNSILDIINNESKKKSFKDLKIVCIGGGTGMPTVLSGLKKYTSNLTAIVGITDSGRSSGRLRKELGVLPPGDIRNCLISLSESEQLLHDLFQYRFKNGSLEGHSIGNLLIAALSDISGSFEKGISQVGKILNIKGDVIPVSLDENHLCAELENGTIVEEEDNITRRYLFDSQTSPIKKIFMKNTETKANSSAITALNEADLIIIGPGSHYISVINNFLYPEINDAINSNTHAKKVYVCNVVTQPHQTDNFSAYDHVNEIINYLGGSIDFVILNSKELDSRLLKKYEDDGSFLVKIDLDRLKKLNVTPILADVVEEITEKKILFEKKDLLRHDSNKIAEIILKLINETDLIVSDDSFKNNGDCVCKH